MRSLENWEKTTLGSVSADISYGYTASASEKPVGPKFLRITDIQNDFVNWGTVPYCQISESNRKKYQLDVGDICVARTGATTGTTYTVKENVEAVFASYLIRYKIDKKVADPFYVGHLLRSDDWNDHVRSIIGGSAQPGANAKQFATFEFPLPPLSEQRAITKILSDLDEKIELSHRMNKTLEAIAQALFKRWFVDFEFPNEKGRPYKSSCRQMVDSELGEIPKGWKISTVGETFNLTMGQSPPGETYNESAEGLPFFQGRADFGFRYPSLRVFCTEPTRFAEAGDTLISVRAPVGDINMAFQKCAIGRGVASARHKTGSRLFTYYFMRSIRSIFDSFEAEGTVFGSIGKEGFRSIEMASPPFEVIQKFEDTVYPIDQMIENNERQSLELVSVRDSLLPKLMAGEIRVSAERVERVNA